MMMGGACRVQVGEVVVVFGLEGRGLVVLCFAHSLQPWDSLNC